MAETGGARCLHASLDVLASDVHSRLEFHKSAYTDYAGINNALHCVMEEKANLELQQNGKNSCVLVGIFISFSM